MPCNIIAAGKGNSANNTPIRIMPPAMPRMPKMNEVTSTATPMQMNIKVEDTGERLGGRGMMNGQ